MRAEHIPEMAAAMAALAQISRVLVVRADMLAMAVLVALRGVGLVLLRPDQAAAEAAEAVS